MDDLVAAYLNEMAEYERLARDAGRHWRAAHIELAHAQQARPVGQHMYDLRAQASTTTDAELQLKHKKALHTAPEGRAPSVAGLAPNPIQMFGAWPTAALLLAQNEFAEALALRVAAARAERRLVDLETQIRAARAPAARDTAGPASAEAATAAVGAVEEPAEGAQARHAAAQLSI